MSDLLIEVDEMVMDNIISKNLDTNIIKPLTKLIVKEREDNGLFSPQSFIITFSYLLA